MLFTFVMIRYPIKAVKRAIAILPTATKICPIPERIANLAAFLITSINADIAEAQKFFPVIPI